MAESPLITIATMTRRSVTPSQASCVPWADRQRVSLPLGPLARQAKLLRMLQDGHFERLGSTCTLHATERKRFFHATRTARPHLHPGLPLSLGHG
jgi:hypothetical protein